MTYTSKKCGLFSAEYSFFQEKDGNGKKKEDVDDLKKELDMDWHKISWEECCSRLETNIETVSHFEVEFSNAIDHEYDLTCIRK